VKCDHAHLVLVPNPAHNPAGDFSLQGAVVRKDGSNKLTYSGIAVYHPRLFEGCSAGKFSVVPLLERAMRDQIVTGERHDGAWNDIGTIARLEQAREFAANS
jgi:MurNAc alpha-1-phosphate uridylyltransferase